MVLNAAVQMLREADELKEKISKFKVGTSMLQDRNLWALQQELQKVYQKVLVLDLDYALDKKVEQDLWNVGFKQQVEALQAISKDKKNPLRSEGQAMLSWVLQAAAGFYLCLLHQICTTFKLDLPFRRRASLLGLVEGWAPPPPARAAPAPAAARYAAQHCLVHLGDLARYRQQLRVAHTFYRHALVVSPHSGQPYNQLALVSWRRGRRLAALYWHARSLLVRAPFPPAPANLARTLRAAASETAQLPVLPGITTPAAAPAEAATPVGPHRRLDAHTYVGELIKALHLIYTQEDLDAATQLVDELNSSLTALVATESFESMTLIKMAVVTMWLVDWSTEQLSVDPSSQAAGEARAAQLSLDLAAGAVLALLLPYYTAPEPPLAAAPPLYVWLQWVAAHPRVLSAAAVAARPQLWPALAHALTAMGDLALSDDIYDSVPLSEDVELYGFVPLARAHADLHFDDYAAWDAPPRTQQPLRPVSEGSGWEDAALERRTRARRLLQLGRRLAADRPDLLTVSDEDKPTFTSSSRGGEQLSEALEALNRAKAERGAVLGGGGGEEESDSDSEPPPAPTVISEADFREKVREKRVGILKPQGSLERAREERALAFNTQEEIEVNVESEEEEVGEGDVDARRGGEARRPPRVNVAMAAIMRKQEETNKQVKFVTPPPTPDSTGDSEVATNSKEADMPKVIQPKAVKSLANLPIGVKTGGILCLKDKSAGYPHLVNVEPEPKKPEKEEMKEPRLNHPGHSSQNSQQYPRSPPAQSWQNNPSMPPPYEPRGSFQNKNAYGIQGTGLNYNPSYQGVSHQGVGHQGIRLPVVNPKEIDVRTAALQKQSSRQDMFQDRPGHHLTGDKKNFLNDLPPRFANQYRYWQNDSQMSQDNKFRDDNFTSGNLFNQPPGRSWPGPDYAQPPPWWKPDAPNYTNPNFSAQPMNVQPNYFTNVPQNTPYNMQYSQQSKPEPMPSYLQPQTLQNLVTSPNFNTMSNYGSYQQPAVGYDAAMYPQFNKGYQPPGKETGFNKEMIDVSGLGFGNMQLGNLGYSAPPNNNAGTNMERVPESGGSPPAASTYSLFSGAPPPAWGPRPPHHQSLWSGPGGSPLERLLEQQKQLQPPPDPH